MKIFILMGQSNMAGRGRLDEAPPVNSDRIFKLINGRFQPMWEPLHHDRVFSGIGPGPSFAEEFVKHYNEPVGLVPCADGGTSLDEWMPGGILFTNAVNHARLAARSGEIAGILWHQGEGDCSAEKSSTYSQRLRKMANALYEELQLSDIPFIAGELASLPYDIFPGVQEFYPEINRQIHSLCRSDSRFIAVNAEGFSANTGDPIHIDAVSQREFGRRYFAAYKQFATA